MTTLIALLRGINVIGNNRLPMKELSALLTGLGLRDVQTYIQSGNAVFHSNAKNKTALAAKIRAAIEAQHGFAPQVLLLDAAELHQAMAGNPYPEAVPAPRTLHLFFLAEAPQHGSRLASRIEKSLGVASTARNWNTVCKLAEMVA